MDTVGETISFAIPMIPPADILHTAVAVSVADHRNEWIPTLLASQKSGIAVLGFITVCRT